MRETGKVESSAKEREKEKKEYGGIGLPMININLFQTECDECYNSSLGLFHPSAVRVTVNFDVRNYDTIATYTLVLKCDIVSYRYLLLY